MSNTSDIFQLVKSLEKNEIIYFKKEVKAFVGNSDSANYMILFNALIKAKTDNEPNIKKDLPANIVDNYSRVKGYLYKQILKSLRNYYSDRDAKIVVYNLLIDFIILNNRGLIDQAEKIITKIEKLISGVNETTLNLAVSKLRFFINSKKDSFSAVKKYADNTLEIAQDIELGSNLANLFYELQTEVETPSETKADAFKHLDFFNSNKIEEQINATISKNSILALSAQKDGSLSDAYFYISENVKAIEANKNFQKFTPFVLSKMLYNQFLFATRMRDNIAMETILIKMEKGFDSTTGFAMKHEETYNKFLFYKCLSAFILFTNQTRFPLDVFETEIIPKFNNNPNLESNISAYFIMVFCFYFFISNQLKEFQFWQEKYAISCLKTKNYTLLLEIKLLTVLLLKKNNDSQKWIDLEIQNIKNFKNNYKIPSSTKEALILKHAKKGDSIKEINYALKGIIDTVEEKSDLDNVLNKWISTNS